MQLEWSQPQIQGDLVSPRAGHAGVSIDEKWFMVGGGDNKSGMNVNKKRANKLEQACRLWKYEACLCFNFCMQSQHDLLLQGPRRHWWWICPSLPSQFWQMWREEIHSPVRSLFYKCFSLLFTILIFILFIFSIWYETGALSISSINRWWAVFGCFWGL